MFVLGLIILAAAVVGAVELVLANRVEMTFKMWNQTWQIDAFWLAVMGAVLLLAAVIALSLMRASMARHRRLRAERRSLAEENRVLSERAQRAGATGTRRDAPPANPPAASYPGAPPAQPAGNRTDVTEPVDEVQHHGFFARHAMSGRRHSNS
jgi:hypothetical protein